MTTVTVSYGELEPTHDISLSDGSTTYGLIFAGGSRVLQEIPLSPPADAFANEQNNWVGGRGKKEFEDDQTGYYNDFSLWSTTEGKLLPSLQWRFFYGRTGSDTNLPGDNMNIAWWKLYGNDPTNKVARYLAVPFVASSSYNADKGYLYMRKRGSPGTLTFELCSDTTGSPGSVLKTVVTTVTDTVGLFTVFDWTTTQALVSGTTYWVKIYGDAADTSASYWEVLCNLGATSKYSAAGSVWTTSTVTMFHRVTGADVNRQWFFFHLNGGFYAVDKKDDGSASTLIINGVRGTATAGTSTTLTNTNITMVTNQYAAGTGIPAAFIRIYDGTGDGQVRQIASNTTTQFTVSPAWDVTPDTTSRYVVYGTDVWTTITGTPGLGAVTGKPAIGNNVAYFPQGQSVNVRRMRVNASSHDFAADGTNRADLIFVNTEQSTPQAYLANAATATVRAAPATVAWGTDLTLGTQTYYVGSSEYRITNMTTYNKILHIFKEDGPYSLNNGIVERIGANFADIPDTRTGIAAATQGNYLWWSWAHSVERMIGSSVDDMLNYKRGFDGLPPVQRGVVSSIVSVSGWLFVAVDGGANNFSTILVYNGMGWHEIYRGWAAGVRIRNLAWQPCPEARGRLWFDVNGDIACMEFPLWAANPLHDSNQDYTPEAVLTTASYDNHDQQLYKVIANLRVFLEYGTVEVDYQINSNVGTGTWTVLGTASTTPVTDLAVNLGGVFKIRFRFRLTMANTRFPTILNGWQLTGRMMQPSKYQYVCTFQASTDGETKTSETDHDPNTLYTQLQTWAVRQTKLTMRALSYSADNKAVTISLPSKSVDNIDEDQWSGRISLAILEI